MNKARLRALLLVIALASGLIQLNGSMVLANDTTVTVPLEGENKVLYPPFEIKGAMTVKDGGTLVIVVEDSQKNLFELCLDGRMNVPLESRYLYVNASYPDAPLAKRVTFCSEAQRAIVEILKSAKIDKTNEYANENVVQAMIQQLEGKCVQPLQISGKWETNWGELIFSQDGISASGTYTHDSGKIEGKLEGNTLRGKWSESPSYAPPHDAGDFEFVFSEDAKTFSGNWRYGFEKDTWDGQWTGKRI